MLTLADVAVVVSDAEASAAWWSTHLGFVRSTIGGSGHAVLVAPPGDRFVLHLCEGFVPRERGNTGIAFVTDEIEALAARMRAGGVRFPMPLRKEAWGSHARFSDPDGNVFWLLGAPTAMVRSTRLRRARTPPRPGPKRGANRSRSARTRPRRARRRTAPGDAHSHQSAPEV